MAWISHRCAQCGRQAQLDASMVRQYVKCPACGKQGLILPPSDAAKAVSVPSGQVVPPPIAIPEPPMPFAVTPIPPPLVQPLAAPPPLAQRVEPLVAAAVMAPPPVQMVAAPMIPSQPMQRNTTGMLPNEADDEWAKRRDRRRSRRNVVRFVAGVGALGLLVRLLLLLK